MFKAPDGWSELDCIDFLQRQIIVSSIIYYEMNDNMISDKEYDARCKQLVQMMDDCIDVEASQYWYAFYDFDGTTGFHLYDRLNEKDKEFLTIFATHVRGHKTNKKKKK